ncbi:condensin-2 complex subunit D3 [Panicum miliaceum]|uniref:Condensin-2 complex subunit D3 n=1 Tax=Panicum miliaceum TaxID=4540 RepID=A0A3L6PFY7_PANMI|nr:condensin-2 complex subunit D3 [Panicum miliaceum]
MKEWLQAVPPLVINSETSIQEECENLFLELVSSFAPKSLDWNFLSHHWKLLDNVRQDDRGKACSQVEPRVSLLQTISNVSMELPVEPAAELAHSLLTRIENFNMNLSEVCILCLSYEILVADEQLQRELLYDMQK